MAAKPTIAIAEEPTPDPGSAVMSSNSSPDEGEEWEIYEPADLDADRSIAERVFGKAFLEPDAASLVRDDALYEAGKLYGRDFEAERAALKDGTHPSCRLKRSQG